MDAALIHHACSLPKNGKGKLLNEAEAVHMLESDKLAWIHLNAAHPEVQHWLNKHVSYLDDIVLGALLAEDTRPRFEAIEGGMLLILRGVNLNENADPEDMVSIRIWADTKRVITLGRRPLKAIGDLKNRVVEEASFAGADEFISALISQLTKRMEPTLDQLEERTDLAEEKVLQEPDKSLRNDIVDIRQEAILLRRYIAPQKDAVLSMQRSEISWISAKTKRRLQENYDRLLRYVEDIDALRERAQIVQDELTNTLSDRINKNMYILSVIAAIFLPLGFLTGLLGINVGGIPGTDSDSAFTIVCIVMSVLVVLQILLFRKMRWF